MAPSSLSAMQRIEDQAVRYHHHTFTRMRVGDVIQTSQAAFIKLARAFTTQHRVIGITLGESRMGLGITHRHFVVSQPFKNPKGAFA